MNAASALRASAPGSDLSARVTTLRLAVALTLLALAVRLIGISLRPLWLDEAYSAWFSGRSWHELWTVVPTYETHPPFYYSALKLWRGLFGASALSLRLLSILLGAATVPVVIAAAGELERLRPTGRPLLLAGIAGFLVACGPTLVEHGQEARPYALMAFAYGARHARLAARLLRMFADEGSGRMGAIGRSSPPGPSLTLWSHALGLLYCGCLAERSCRRGLAAAAPRQRYVRGIATAARRRSFLPPCLWLIAGRAHDWGTGWLGVEPEMLLTLFAIYGVRSRC